MEYGGKYGRAVFTEKDSKGEREGMSCFGSGVVFIEVGSGPQRDLQARENIWSHFFFPSCR